jgi:phosphopantothenoylcysteine decarboxylase/phosphopantothenate--cysteine ligase
MRIIITAGGTREYIDPVRFISNASSGKMGYALAHAAIKAGHKVMLITAPTTQRPPGKATLVKIETTVQMFKAAKKHFNQCDCLIMAAAVADYTPASPVKTKMKKTGKSITLKLKPTPDILKWATSHKKKTQIIVGFALEDKAIRTRAQTKLQDKNLDMIVANSPSAIGAVKSNVQIKTLNSSWLEIQNTAKSATATKIIHMVEKLHRASFK